jgi:hypothetical protein
VGNAPPHHTHAAALTPNCFCAKHTHTRAKKIIMPNMQQEEAVDAAAPSRHAQCQRARCRVAGREAHWQPRPARQPAWWGTQVDIRGAVGRRMEELVRAGSMSSGLGEADPRSWHVSTSPARQARQRLSVSSRKLGSPTLPSASALTRPPSPTLSSLVRMSHDQSACSSLCFCKTE